MLAAIKEAKESRRLHDYAIGAVIVKNGEIIARAGNRIRTESDPTSHTEIVAIRMACRDLGTRYLKGCAIYSTHAPCAMCTNACVWAKMSLVVYGASQRDILTYGQKHGNGKFKWRAIEIEPGELYKKYLKVAHPNMKILQMMRKRCNTLFHNE